MLIYIFILSVPEMSRATKRKRVLIEVLQDDFSHPNDDQQIVRVVSSRGNNLHEVETPDGSKFLVSMPTKFRKNVWVKRGSYILVEPIKEGDKVKAEMVRLLTNEHIKVFRKEGVWPAAFDIQDSKSNSDGDANTNVGYRDNDIISTSNSESSSEESDSE